VKSALVQSGIDATSARGKALGPLVQGGGVVALGRADSPLLFASPTAVSFGLVSRGETRTTPVALADGGGAGTWTVVRVLRDSTAGVRVTVPGTVEVPGTFEVGITVSPSAPAGDVDGYLELRQAANVRRVPFWGHVTTRALAGHRTTPLPRAGTYRGTTVGQPALVARYRYPATPRGLGVTTILRGPERVYTIRLRKAVANLGVVITSRAPGSRVEPRVVAGLDENRLTGFAALPVVYNPYLDQFRDLVPAAGALSPVPGEYALVFDSGTRSGAGRFTFRYWVNDVTPPTVHIRTRTVSRGAPLRIAASDAGSGVYPGSIEARVDGDDVRATFRDGIVSVPTAGLARGTHRLRISVSDYQETKNTENVARILPNTRTVSTTFSVR
jgi:hypothetical protein